MILRDVKDRFNAMNDVQKEKFIENLYYHVSDEIFEKAFKDTYDFNKEKEINGWKYYRNPMHGKMVAYHKAGQEQLTFSNDESFKRWLESEMKE